MLMHFDISPPLSHPLFTLALSLSDYTKINISTQRRRLLRRRTRITSRCGTHEKWVMICSKCVYEYEYELKCECACEYQVYCDEGALHLCVCEMQGAISVDVAPAAASSFIISLSLSGSVWIAQWGKSTLGHHLPVFPNLWTFLKYLKH